MQPDQPDPTANWPLRIVVGVDQHNRPGIHGHIGNEIIALGALEKGKQLLREVHRELEAQAEAKAKAGAIIIPNGTLPRA